MTAPPAASGRDDNQRPKDWALLTFCVIEAVAFPVIVAFHRFAWFSGDEWDFLSARSASSLHDLFLPHNEHWSTLPVLAFRLLYATVGLRSYVPYLMLVVALHLLVAALLRRVMVRAAVNPWIATTAAASFAVFGAGSFNIVYAFQIGFDGSLAFGLAQLLLADHDGALDHRDWVGLGCGVAGLMCSGVAVSITVAVGIAVLARRGWRLGLLHTAPLAAIYLTWFAAIGRTARSTYATPSEVIRFVGRSLWATFVALGQSGFVGGALVAMLLVGTAAALAKRRDAPARDLAPVFALLVAAVVFVLVAGAGRAIDPAAYIRADPVASRYLHIVAAMVTPAVAVAADALVRRRRLLSVVVAPLLLVGLPGNVHRLLEGSQVARNQTDVYRHFVLALPRLEIAGELPASTSVDPFFDPWMTIGWLRDGVRSGRVPSPGPISDDQQAALTFSEGFRTSRDAPAVHTCLALSAGQKLTLHVHDELIIVGVVPLRYLPPSGRVLPPVPIGSGSTEYRVVIARSMTVRVERLVGSAQVRVCKATRSS